MASLRPAELWQSLSLEKEMKHVRTELMGNLAPQAH